MSRMDSADHNVILPAHNRCQQYESEVRTSIHGKKGGP